MKRSHEVTSSARGMVLLVVAIVAAFAPQVVHLFWLGTQGKFSSLNFAWVLRATVWPVLMAFTFLSVWRGSRRSMRFLGWLFCFGAVVAALGWLAPLRKPFPAPIWPSVVGWTVAAGVLLISKDAIRFVDEQRSKKKA